LLHPIACRDHRGDLSVDCVQHEVRGATHVTAWLSTGFPDAEERGNLAEREAELLRVSNEHEPVHDAFAVLTITRGRSRRLREQAKALVIANRVRRHAGAVRHDPNRKALAHPSW
jgi:hypothetical protein